MNRHRHVWCEDDSCSACGAQRCHATQLRSAILLQSSRCRRATQDGSLYCRRHRYLDRARARKLTQTLPLQPDPQLKAQGSRSGESHPEGYDGSSARS